MRPLRPVRPVSIWWLTLVLAALAGCGGGDGSGPDVPDPGALAPLVGTWDATAFVHTLTTDASTSADIIALGGVFRVVIEASGRYTGTIQLATESRVETGQMRVVAGELVIQPLSPPGPEERVRFQVAGNTMTWTGSAEYDFNLDGIPQATNVRIEFARP